jgi:hypothetical protein
VAFKEGTTVVKIKPYSAAYFAVLDAMPELRATFAVAEHVVVTGKHVAIETSADGAEQLDASQLRMLREKW